MSLRSGLFTLAFVFAGALAFIVIALTTVILIVDHDSGAPFNDSAGATPAPATSEGDQVASRQGSTAHDGSGKWAIQSRSSPRPACILSRKSLAIEAKRPPD